MSATYEISTRDGQRYLWQVKDKDSDYGNDHTQEQRNLGLGGKTIGGAWAANPAGRLLETELKLKLEWAYRRFEIANFPDGKSGTHGLYLYNVIVALEWNPSIAFIQGLQQGFRRMSDRLYQASDNRLALGQVVFGDHTWMPFADIQIMASSQMLPRTWVGGLLHDAKYSPIRAGRGLWGRQMDKTLDWDEGQSYPALAHEWCHYALGLKDTYLNQQPADYHNRPGTQTYKLVLPKTGIGADSIMGDPFGHGVLDPRDLHLIPCGLGYRDLMRYNPLGLDVFPFDFPLFYIGEEFDSATPIGRKMETKDLLPSNFLLEPKPLSGQPPPLPYVAEQVRLDVKPFPQGVRRDSTLFVIQKPEHQQQDRVVVAQGRYLSSIRTVTNPDNTTTDEVLLLGARAGDDILLLGRDPRNTSTVLPFLTNLTPLDLNDTDSSPFIRDEQAWSGAPVPTLVLLPPQPRPIVDVVPDRFPANPPSPRNITVHSTVHHGAGWKHTLLPLGRPGTPADAMDGQVLLMNDDDPLIYLACSYSRGGVPPSGYGAPTNPISAGSGDGGALIFGYLPEISPPPAKPGEGRGGRDDDVLALA